MLFFKYDKRNEKQSKRQKLDNILDVARDLLRDSIENDVKKHSIYGLIKVLTNYHLYDEKMRKLSRVRKLWDGILNTRSIVDVFTDKMIDKGKYDIDHFIPWSFVMNDELWNLMPMESSLNSSKNNKLPNWNDFFIRFAKNQYILYGMIHKYDGIRKLYEACYRDNLHSIWANQELYRKGNSEIEFVGILEKNMRPVYDSARRQGYDIWNRGVI